MPFLTPKQLDFFHENGFLVIPDFFTKEQAVDLLNHSHSLLETFDMQTHPLTKFTSDDSNHVGDDYFLDSGDKIVKGLH